MSIQASALGIALHQMGGFSADKAKELFSLNDQVAVISTIAMGYYGEADDLEEPLKSRELAPRSRKPLSEIAFHGELH
jgi:nitroreductase